MIKESVMYKPLATRLLIKRIDEVDKTAGGIIIPDSAKEKPIKATVIAVGKDVEEVKAGDTVLFSKWGGTEIKIDNEDYLVIKEDDIFAVEE